MAALVAIALIGTLGPMAMMRWNLDGLTGATLSEEIDALRDGMRRDASGVPMAFDLSEETRWLQSALPDDLMYRLVDAGGRVRLSSVPGGAALAPTGRPYEAERSTFTFRGRGIDVHARSVPVRVGTQVWVLQVAVTDRLVKFSRMGRGNSHLRAIVVPIGILVVALGLSIVLTTRRMLAPLRRASHAAERIAPSHLQQRLSLQGLPTEVLPLVCAFNDALTRVEQGFKAQQEFLAQAAHELKTPLALMRAQLEAEGVVPGHPLLQDVELMSRQVQQLLHLAEVSEARNFVFERVDAGSVAAAVVDYLERLALAAGVTLVQRPGQTEAAPRATIRADRGAFFILLKNLIENAIQHAPRGSTVAIEVGETGLRVVDQGPGIAATDLPRLFDRFWRAEPHRGSGAGLGLTICLQIVQAHGWRLWAGSAGSGHGACFTLSWEPA